MVSRGGIRRSVNDLADITEDAPLSLFHAPQARLSLRPRRSHQRTARGQNRRGQVRAREPAVLSRRVASH